MNRAQRIKPADAGNTPQIPMPIPSPEGIKPAYAGNTLTWLGHLTQMSGIKPADAGNTKIFEKSLEIRT